MDADMFRTIISSLASALVSSFLAAYLTYRYMDLSWRRRRHLEDIKENCLKDVLSNIGRFKSFYTLSENQVFSWIRDEMLSRGLSSVDWCIHFSFGFEDPL